MAGTAASSNANPEEVIDPNDDVEVDPSVQNDPDIDGSSDDDPSARTAPREEYTEREKTLMNKARAEEKKKLYGEKKQLQEKITDLQRQIRSAGGTPSQANNPAPTNTGETGNNDDLRQLISSLQNDLRETREENRSFRNETNLRDYRVQKIAEVRDAGSDVVEGLISGTTEEEIDIAVDLARAEFEFLRDKHGFSGQPTNGGSRSTTVIREGRNRPQGVPRPPRNPSQVNDSDDDSMSLKEIRNAIGGGAGIRSGDYAKLRPKILAALQRGKIRQ